MHRSKEPPDPRQYNPQISDGLAEVILKVLAKEPSARYRTADQLGRVLLVLGERLSQIDENPPPLQTSTVNSNVQASYMSNQSELSAPDRDKQVRQIDWKLVSLELLALLLVGGLIPFWLFIILRLSSLVR